jgi:hypothetical protein
VVEVVNNENSSSLPVVHQKSTDEETSRVFDELIKHLKSLEKHHKQYAKKHYASIDWNPILLPLIIPLAILFFFSIIILYLKLTFLYRLLEPLLYLTLASLLFSAGQMIWRAWSFIQQAKQQRPLESGMIEELKNEALFEREIVINLSRVSQYKLKYVESYIKELIEEIQARDKRLDSSLPIFSFAFVIVLSLLIPFTYPSKLDFQQPEFLAKSIGFLGIGISFLSPLLKYFSTSATQTKILNCRKCLFLLSQAQALVDDMKATNGGKITATEPPSGQPRFMSKLRSLGTIDLPFDFDHDSHTLISREHGDQGEKSSLH